MNHYNTIQTKLEQFISKYYTNELIKGGILFFAIGLLYFLITLLVEHFLWLSPTARTILFWVFIAVEVALFAKFIAVPLAKLFKLQKGIDYTQASKLIGNHFPEVNDKLLNVLQLKDSNNDSELLLASIEQKSAELSPIPFKLAINLKQNTKYLKYAAIPIVILLLSYVTGKFNWFSDSYKRVVNYQTAYEPPAPFQFFVVNNDLNATENKDFKLQVKTAGELTPENVSITYNNETYVLQNKGVGEFEYVFTRPKQNVEFLLSANNITSKPYTLTVSEVPSLQSFEMVLDYPSYTQKRDEVLKSTGNATVPQGTTITWKLHTKATDQVNLYAKDTLAFKALENGKFQATKQLYNNLDYSLSTSNNNLKDYENLAFSITVIKDDYPELNVTSKTDSLDLQTLYFYGKVSDDYGLKKLNLVYYPSDNSQDKKLQKLELKGKTISDFITAFPNNLEIEEGIPYELYFEVHDQFKSVKSQIFSYRKRTQKEEEQKQLDSQNETIKNLDKTLDRFDNQEKNLEELQRLNKEKEQLSFNDKKKLESFLQRQKQQEEMMQQFNKQMQDNLEQFQKDNEEKDPFKEQLQERLEQNEQQLQQDEKLLKELEELYDKISKEAFEEKLDELSKQAKNQKKSLQQMLELTKRYYVTKKLEQLQGKLADLGEEQKKLAESEDNTKDKQEELNKKFDEIKKEIDGLKKDNQKLLEPIKIPLSDKAQDTISEEQKKASEQLEQQQNSQDASQKQQAMQKAQQSQKRAAQQMQQMSQQMQQSMQQQQGEQLDEDRAMLRQIVDNLLVFSFDQEDLMNTFKSIDINHNKYANYLRKQNSLREHFEHIDDSLFKLSLKQPAISEDINKQLTEVFYNIDKSLAEFAENQLYRGVMNQQYTLTAANTLADYLSDTMDNLDMQMNGSGDGSGKSGKGKGGSGGEQQLPDIIKSQEQLNKEMQEGMQKSQGGQPQSGKGSEGESGKGNSQSGQGDKGNKQDGKEDGGDKGNKKGEGKNGEGQKDNKSGKGKDGQDGQGNPNGEDGQGDFNEQMNGELFRIYQEQQKLRLQLQQRLGKDGLKGVGRNVLKEMEYIEDQLINGGFTNRTLARMQRLKHQLLKLENATFKQGQDNKRESKTNNQNFDNNTNNQIPTAKKYFNTTEILNRQALPLQPVYKKKVQEYFKKDD